MEKGEKYMVNKKEFYSIALVSTAMILLLVSIAGAAPFAYITNTDSYNVSVIDTATNTVTSSVPLGLGPWGVAVSLDGKKAYTSNPYNNNVSVINTITNNVTANVSVGQLPVGVAVTPDGSKVYVTNQNSNNVSVIDTATNTVTSTVDVGNSPIGVAVTLDGTKAYVANGGDANVSVIDIGTNTVTATVPVGKTPNGIAITPDGTKVYVTDQYDWTVSVINTTNNTVTTVNLGQNTYPNGVVVTPDGTKVYVVNQGDSDTKPETVSVIDTATNNVTANVSVGPTPEGVAVTPDGSKVYVANNANATVSVIDTGTNTVIATVNVGGSPVAFGQFIGPWLITPIITWNNPADIVYGTPLSNTQLNATASNPITRDTLPGIFVYTPTLGTVLSTGMHTLNVSFTPTDNKNYTHASASVQINVLTPVQKIQQMITLIQGLVTSGKLNHGQANSLIVKLNAAKMNINHENTQAATNELNAFINEVNADIKTDKLSSTDGQTLIDEANAVINAIK
jgi:YVTN family beta-propeller protein